ncbi:hypothetical protein NKDENANG_00313 [Candidatus Entotheonellaceae bacterium PAL068K]
MTSERCADCHADIYRQGSQSAQRFSSFNNPWYGKAIEDLQDVIGVRPSRWYADWPATIAGCILRQRFAAEQCSEPLFPYRSLPLGKGKGWGGGDEVNEDAGGRGMERCSCTG